MATPPDDRLAPPSGPPHEPRRPAPIDLEALADKIYRLMLAELRLAQLRASHHGAEVIRNDSRRLR